MSEKKEIKIEIPVEVVEKIEKLSSLLSSFKGGVISKEKVEEALKLLDELKKRLPEVHIDLEKIIDALEGTGSEVKLSFNNLSLNGDISLKIIPIRREKKE
ncbi:hypothetical protein [Methanocaldococcus infernus]